MKYPRINNWLIFEPVRQGSCRVTDCLYDEVFLLSGALARFAKQLDGKTDPYAVDPRLSWREVRSLLQALEENDLLRQDRILCKSLGTICLTLCIPRVTPLLRAAAFLINLLLNLLWLPLLLAGILLFWNRLPPLEGGSLVAGCLCGLLAGISLHELGHACACLAHRGRVFELGVMVQNFLPGAYVLMDIRTVKNRMARVQIYSAGVQMNLLLTGILLLLTIGVPAMSGAFFCAAVINAFLALLNLTFIEGLDGTAIISELIGAEDLVGSAKRALFSRKRRQRLMKKGAAGGAVLVLSALVLLLQLALPMIYCLNFAEVIQWLF